MLATVCSVSELGVTAKGQLRRGDALQLPAAPVIVDVPGMAGSCLLDRGHSPAHHRSMHVLGGTYLATKGTACYLSIEGMCGTY